jgi:hypothetical protein
MTRNKLLQALLVASLTTLAASAGAQNATPREPTPGQAQPQNGSPIGGTPSTAPSINSQYNPDQQNWQSTPGSQARVTDDQAKTYLEARQACAAQPLLQQAACNDEVTSRFGAIDAKCQKLSGSALVDCVHGVDHGG